MTFGVDVPAAHRISSQGTAQDHDRSCRPKPDALRTPALIEMERQREIEFFRIETFGRARKGRCKTNSAKGEPVKLRVATGPVERESAQIAARTAGKGNQRLAPTVKARRPSGGNPCPPPPAVGLSRGAHRRHRDR